MIAFLLCFLVGCYIIATMIIALDIERILAIIIILWMMFSAIRELFR